MGTPLDEAGATAEKSQAEIDAEAAVKAAEENLAAVKKTEGDVDTDQKVGDELPPVPEPTPEAEFTPPTVAELADAANKLREQGLANVATYLDKYAEQRIKEGAETAGEPKAPDGAGEQVS